MAEQRRDETRDVVPVVEAGEIVQAEEIRQPGGERVQPHTTDGKAGIGAVGGLIAGAAAGAAIGGPVGAVVGGGLGVAAGAQAGQSVAAQSGEEGEPGEDRKR